jgi:hypothetical protein
VRDALMDRLERMPALLDVYRNHYLSRAETVNNRLLLEGEHNYAKTGGSRRPMVRHQAERAIDSP